MSLSVMLKVFNHSTSKANERLVLLVIADCCGEDGTGAELSIDDIAKKANIDSPRTVQRCIESLANEICELEIVRGVNKRSRFRVRLEKLDGRQVTSAGAAAGVGEDEVASTVREYERIIPWKKQERITHHQKMRIREFCLGYGTDVVREAIAAMGDSPEGFWAPDKLRERCGEILQQKRRAESAAAQITSAAVRGGVKKLSDIMGA